MKRKKRTRMHEVDWPKPPASSYTKGQITDGYIPRSVTLGVALKYPNAPFFYFYDPIHVFVG